MTDPMKLIATLNTLSESFHKIMMSYEAEKMLASDDKRIKRMSEKLVAAIQERRLTAEQITELCADGFKTCVELMVELGAPDAAIYSCTPSSEHDGG